MLAISFQHATKEPWLFFILLGGYVYFNKAGAVVRVNALSVSGSPFSLTLVGPIPGSTDALEVMGQQGRLTDVTLNTLRDQGYRRFGWINPGEKFKHAPVTTIATYDHGAFIYGVDCRATGAQMALIFVMAQDPSEQSEVREAMDAYAKANADKPESAEVVEAKAAMEGAFRGLNKGWQNALSNVLKDFDIEKRTNTTGVDTLYCKSKLLTNLVIYMAHMPLGSLLFALFWLFFAPIFYSRVFLPCWECFDFSAMIAHEVGHLLGFDHPDTKPGMNLVSNVSLNNETCVDPLAHVSLSPHPSTSGGPFSIMHSSTLRRSITCLTDDDLQGLDMLYPDCDGGVRAPVCHGENSSSGWLRLFFAVALPFVTTVVVLLVPICAVRQWQRAHVRALEQHVRGLQAKGAWNRAGIAVRTKVVDQAAKKRVRTDRLYAAMHQARLEAARAEGRAARMELEAAKLTAGIDKVVAANKLSGAGSRSSLNHAKSRKSRSLSLGRKKSPTALKAPGAANMPKPRASPPAGAKNARGAMRLDRIQPPACDDDDMHA